MKKLALVSLVLGALALTGLGRGYFVGAEIIPHTFTTATYGIPYLTIGYDAGWGYASIGFASPGRLNTWMGISGGGLWGLTTQLYLGGGVTFWLKLEDFAIADNTWSVNFRAFYFFDGNLCVSLAMHVPLQVDPNAFLLGSWISFGLTYYIWAGAPATGK